MLDATARRLIGFRLNDVGAWLAATGLKPNVVTIGGLAIGVLIIPVLAFQVFGFALIIILFNRLLDGLDGAIARSSGITDLGGYLDIVADFLFY